MRSPGDLLDTMEIQMDRGVDQNMPYRQIEATLILAQQVKRIADLLDQSSIGDEGNRTLFVATEDST